MKCIFVLGISSTADCEGQLSELEAILDSKVKSFWSCNLSYFWCIMLLLYDCSDLFIILLPYDSLQICAVADRSEINMFVPSAKEVNRYYDAKLFIHEELKTKLRLLLDKVYPYLFLLILYFFCHYFPLTLI